jgi:Ser/Thr protein kinase RdoA (MazF antagonist)
MEVAHSVLTAESVGRLVEQHYDLGSMSWSYLYGGSNAHYLATDGERQCVLRLLDAHQPWSRPGEPIDEGVQFEIEMLAFLRDQGIRACRPIPQRDGRCFAKLSAPEGDRYFTLFEHIAGGKPGRFDGPRASRFGAAVAQLHRAMTKLAPRAFRYELGPGYLVDQTLELFSAHGRSLSPGALPYLEQTAKSIRQAMMSLPKAAPCYIAIHGDVHFGNVIEDRHGELWLIDFETAGLGWRVYDVASFTALSRMGWGPPLAEGESIESINQAFLDGYQGVCRLNEAELHALSHFERARLFEFLGYWMHEIRAGKIGIENRMKHVDTVVSTLKSWDRESPEAPGVPGFRPTSLSG